MKLYELTEQFLALQELAYDPEVDEQTFQDTMEGLWGEIEDKADGYALFSFNIQKNGGLQPLVIDGLLEDIPGRFLIPQPPVPNNEAIRALLENKAVEWAHLEPRGESLRIR